MYSFLTTVDSDCGNCHQGDGQWRRHVTKQKLMLNQTTVAISVHDSIIGPVTVPIKSGTFKMDENKNKEKVSGMVLTE